YVRFFAVPYVGLQYSTAGTVIEAYGPVAELVQNGDVLLSVNGVSYDEYRANLVTPWFGGVQPGDPIQLRVATAGEEREIEYRAPGFSFAEFSERYFTTWWLSYVFWVTGTIVFLQVR